MTRVIGDFEGEFRFLSNFDMSDPTLKNRLFGYPSVEHFYQAMKTTDLTRRQMIKMADTPGGAKRLGNSSRTLLRLNWDIGLKDEVMAMGLELKFEAGTELAAKLVGTGSAILIEGNTWHDNYWGDCRCGRVASDFHDCSVPGLNKLGLALMAIRHKLVTGS